MKLTLLTTLCGLLFLTLSLNSCQKEELSGPNSPITPRANAQPTITYSPNPGIVGQPVTVNLEYGTCGTGQLQEEVPVGTGIWVPRGGHVNASAANPDISYSFTPTLAGTCAYKFRAQVSGGQNCTAYTGAQPGVCLEVINPCNDSLTATVNCDTDANGCNRHVTFTFTAEEAGPIVIQGGLTAFTEICSATATGGLVLNPTHPSAGGPSNVTRWEGNVLGDCVEYTITIHWTSTNNDPAITGVWTAKRGEVTLASLCKLTCSGSCYVE